MAAMKSSELEKFKKAFIERLQNKFSVSPEEASDQQVYEVLSALVVEQLKSKRRRFINQVHSAGKKQVYYLSMEFLMGRSLKTSLYNLEMAEGVTKMLKGFDINIDKIYECEPDAGLGNGGLGRLAACYMDAMATQDMPAMGHSICYEYGIFKQRLEDGWQTELPDNWLPGGGVWLDPKPERSVEIHFEGDLNEYWDNQYHHISHVGYSTVVAVPYDMYVSGHDSKGVSVLRLWTAKAPSFNMEMFNQGDYAKALGQNSIANAISKVLYPNDNHLEGKSLRLRQQYFLCAASVGDIVNTHMNVYGTLDNLHEKVAIHINDTHPTLAIPELMRILMDQHHFSWEHAWEITSQTISYTNHTVLPEALEVWNENLFAIKLPRIHSIIREINERFCKEAWEKFMGDWDKVGRMSVLDHGMVRMANLSVIGSHHVNGVSGLHSDILKTTVFKDYNDMYPERFTNVTNGIAHRKWLCYSNPRLAALLDETIGKGYRKNPAELENFAQFIDDASVLERLEKIKKQNKTDFAKYIKDTKGIRIDPDSIFDVQAKRLHEYKRQLLNAIHIIDLYQQLKENPDLDVPPKTFLFAAKAAPGYYLAKDILRLICYIGADIEKDPVISKKLRVVFLENYNVTLAEHLMPAAEISQQISLAGKEASGTGNMKFMINGALTIGTLDGANVEMASLLGKDNIFIFGHTAEEVEELWRKGYSSSEYYNRSAGLKRALDSLQEGYAGRSFSDIARYLLYSYGVSDPFMCLADYDYYAEAHERMIDAYADRKHWNQMSLMNIAKAGFFAADRSIREYADNIWNLKPIKK